MSDSIVHANEPITLVGGGEIRKKVVRTALGHGSGLVAADGGAARLLTMGYVPDAVIGDFDSLDSASCAAIPPDRLHRITEQDSTDFEKCLRNIDAPLVIGVGFGGGRIDHQLAVYHGMLRHPDRPCILLGRHDLLFLAPPELELVLPNRSRFSAFPMMPVEARSQGLRWPLAGVDLAPGRMIGTSNEVTGPVKLSASAPGLLVILPARLLKQAVRLFVGSHDCAPAMRWPAHTT